MQICRMLFRHLGQGVRSQEISAFVQPSRKLSSRIRQRVSDKVQLRAAHRDVADSFMFRAACHPGLEAVVADELSNLPAPVRNIEWKLGKAGVDFSGASMATAYHACIRLRAAIRVLHLLGTGAMDPRGSGYDELYALIQRIADWREYLQPGMTLDMDIRMNSCSGWNNKVVAERCVRDAISDKLRSAGREKPGKAAPGGVASLTLYISMFQDEVKVYRDVAGESLHRRGYRAGSAIHKAALNEAAAAGVLYQAGWPAAAKEGTLLLEAALMAHNVAPGLMRQRWALQQWHDHDAAAWADAVAAARADVTHTFGGIIAGNDIVENNLVLARSGIAALKMQKTVRLHLGNCADWTLPRAPDVVVTNPPWGVRLLGRAPARGAPEGLQADDTSEDDLDATWTDLRTFLKSQCAGSTAWILCGNKLASRALRMSVSQRIPMTLSGVDCRLLKYNILADATRDQDQVLSR